MSSIFGSFANNQQPQQPQNNAFGQPGFGGGTGFGAFGQNTQQQQQQQQPQQPTVNPMFGGLAASTTAPSGGFGAFSNPSTSTNAFNQTKPTFGAAGGSAFGNPQPSAFGNTTGGAFGGGGNVFGASGSGTSAFSAQAAQPQQSAFGGGSLFGNKPQGTGFGSTALGVTTSTPSIPTTGSANPPFQEVQEREPAPSNTMLHFQSISCMPEYRNISFEELRVQDYQQGRKVANAGGGFGASTGFGVQTQPTTNAFGSTTAPSAFGSQTQQPTTGFGAFGQAQQQPQQNAFSGFGGQQQQNPQQTTGFGGFNQQQQPTTGFGGFNQQNPQQQPSGGFNSFSQPKGFGIQNQTNSSPFGAFGAANNTAQANPSSFGTTQPQQQQQQNPSPFGGFQANPQNPLLKPSVFGTPSPFVSAGQQQQQPQAGAFGGNTQQPQGGLFGNTGQPNAFSQPAQQPNAFGGTQPVGGGLFGNNQNQQQNQQQQQQTAPGSGFGSLFNKPAGSGLFGNTQPTIQTQPLQNPNPSNPLFSGGGGLFGNSTTNTQQQPSTSTGFGSGATGGLFGNTKLTAPAPSFGSFGGGGGIFGNNNQQQQQPSGLGGGGLFGNGNAQPQGQQSSMFNGSGLFSNTATQQQQPNLTASIDQPLPSTLPTLPPLASSMSPDKKRSNVFADVAARANPRYTPASTLGYTPPAPGSKLRGFGTSIATITGRPQSPFSSPAHGASPGKAAIPFAESKSLLSPEAFTNGAGGSLQLLGGARQSVKKLILEKPVDQCELHKIHTQHGGAISPFKGREVRFNPALGVAAREKDNNEPVHDSTPLIPQRTTSTAKTTALAVPEDAILDPQEGEYWCLPTVKDLQRLSFNELQGVKNFTVGRVGYGTIQFLQPVDLTSVPSIADVPGKIVAFEHMECTLYTDERLRPPAGEGLNVPARIKLDKCWAIDKSTRELIKDPKDLKYQQRLRKMQGQEGAEFIGFDNETGVWEFTVQEF